MSAPTLRSWLVAEPFALGRARAATRRAFDAPLRFDAHGVARVAV